MKRLLVFFALFAIICSCSSPREGKYRVSIYATNDLHGKFFDSLYSGNKANRVSMANISAYMKERRASDGEENIVFLDLGDALQGDNASYYSNFIDTNRNDGHHLFARIAEYMGYDALVVGNHDIETGHPVYDRLLDELHVPYLAANSLKNDGSGSYFDEYAIIRRGGLKIAVIGMTNPNIKSWLDESLWSGMHFVEIEHLADSLVRSVKAAENPDVTILAIHAGLGDGSNDLENPARYLASKLQGVDVIFAAHDHQMCCEKIFNGTDSTLLLEGACRAQYLSHADIELEFSADSIVGKRICGELVPMEGVEKCGDYLACFKDYFNKVKSFTNRKVGTLEKDMQTCDAYFGPSDYMSLIHSIQLNASGADISFAAPLTTNGLIKAGDFDFQGLFTIYPFENQLFVIELDGGQIKDYLEYSYNCWIATMKHKDDHIINLVHDTPEGGYSFRNMPYNFDSAANIEYEVDVRQPFGKRIAIKGMTDGRPFHADSLYTVALSSYRASGGGDLLVQGVGIAADSLSSIVVRKLDDLRTLIYNMYTSGEDKNIKDWDNWKFVPESWAADALKRDKALLFPQAR